MGDDVQILSGRDAAGSEISHGSPAVFWDIVEESLDEAEFLWGRRDAALEAPDQTLAQVEAEIEARLLGAIDGLCVGGAAAVDRVLTPAMDEDQLPRIAAARFARRGHGGGVGPLRLGFPGRARRQARGAAAGARGERQHRCCRRAGPLRRSA